METSIYILWIVIIIAAVLIDILTSSFMFVWIGCGALLALFSGSFLDMTTKGQIIIFVISSIVITSICYPLTKKFMKKNIKPLPTMEEDYIGKIFTAEEMIKDESRLKLHGTYWTIKNLGQTIEKGEKFKIVSIEGIKLIIEKN